MPDIAAAYEHGRSAITVELRSRAPKVADLAVPACPDWSVKDLVAHLQHVTVEYAAGRHSYPSLDQDVFYEMRDPDRYDVDAWAEDGVAARRHRSLDELLVEWETTSTPLYRMMGDAPARADVSGNDFLAWAALVDFAIHYQDLRGALGLPPDRDNYCAKLGFAALSRHFVGHVATLDGILGLRLVTARGEVTIGDGSPATIEVDWFELFRAMAGRRTESQLAALLAPLDPAPYLPAFTLYPFASEPLTT